MGYVHDDDEKLSDYQVWLVRQNILILTISLPKAKKKMERVKPRIRATKKQGLRQTNMG